MQFNANQRKATQSAKQCKATQGNAKQCRAMHRNAKSPDRLPGPDDGQRRGGDGAATATT
eukprot:5105094-Pyramimonas_sp.AAC.1